MKVNADKEPKQTQVKINGETREVAEELRLNELIRDLALDPERLAIELNHEVVRRRDWPTIIVKDGDRIEIVHFVGGGCSVSSRQGAAADGNLIASVFGAHRYKVVVV